MTESNKQVTHWSDQKTDVVAILVVFTALVAAAVYFISNQV
jgi:hypothetical protein